MVFQGVLAVLAIATVAPSAPSPSGRVPLIAAIGDSITYGTGTSNPPATSYAERAAALLGDRVVDFGIPGARTKAIAGEVASIPLDADVVLVYAGTNDVAVAADQLATPAAAVTNVKAVEPDFDALLDAIHTRVPAAVLVVVTLRDFGRVGSGSAQPLRFTDASLSAAAHEWNLHVRKVAAEYKARLLDLEADPQWYLRSDYGDDGRDVHPADPGAARLAAAVARLLSPVSTVR